MHGTMNIKWNTYISLTIKEHETEKINNNEPIFDLHHFLCYVTTFVRAAAVQASEYLYFIWHHHYLEPLRFCCFHHNLLSQCNQAGSHTKILALLWCQPRHQMPCMRLLIQWLRHLYRPCLHGQLECYLPQTCTCKVTNDRSASVRSTLKTSTTISQHFWLQKLPW